MNIILAVKVLHAFDTPFRVCMVQAQVSGKQVASDDFCNRWNIMDAAVCLKITQLLDGHR